MTAPEPVGVAADELAAAERTLRSYVRDRPYEEITDELKDLLDEYDRRAARITKLEGMVCTCHQGQAMETQLDRLTAELHARNVDAKSATIQAVGLRADLARALPVVESAGALVEHRYDAVAYLLPGWDAKESVLLDALARAYRAAREPRTGEGT